MARFSLEFLGSSWLLLLGPARKRLWVVPNRCDPLYRSQEMVGWCSDSCRAVLRDVWSRNLSSSRSTNSSSSIILTSGLCASARPVGGSWSTWSRRPWVGEEEREVHPADLYHRPRSGALLPRLLLIAHCASDCFKQQMLGLLVGFS